MATNNAIDLSYQGIAYYNGIGTFSGVDGNTSGYVLTSNGTGVAPLQEFDLFYYTQNLTTAR